MTGCRGEGASKELKSDHIVEASEELGGKWWLLPNLDEALVVVPDRPHTRGEIEASHKGEGAITRVREFRLSTNSQGLRGPEIREKKTGVTRIVALGDSVTHGWGVSREEAYPARLQAELERRGHAAEVINAGVPANRLDTMETWCRVVGKRLEADWILWTRRPDARNSDPVGVYRRHARECARESGAKLMVILPPISTFDPRGAGRYKQEGEALREAFGPHTEVVELTEIFWAAQAGRGEVLRVRDGSHQVVDQESGRVLLESAAPGASDAAGPTQAMDSAIYDLFESAPEVREALFFDEGHPDAEGFQVFAGAVAEALVPHLESSGQ